MWLEEEDMAKERRAKPFFRVLAALVALFPLAAAVSAGCDALAGYHDEWLIVLLALAFLLQFSSLAVRGTGLIWPPLR